MGVVLFELFTGRRPFTADSVAAMMYKHAYEEPPLDEPIAVAIPIHVKPIIRKALAKQRGDRFSSAEALKSALLDVRAGVPTFGPDTTETIVQKVGQLRGPQDETAHIPTPPPIVTPAKVPWQPPRIDRRAWALLTVAIIVGGALIATIWLMLRAPEREIGGSSPGPSPVTTPQAPATTRAGGGAASSAAIGDREPSTAASSDADAPAASGGVSEPIAAARSVIAACGRGEAPACGDACDAGDAGSCTQLGVLYNAALALRAISVPRRSTTTAAAAAAISRVATISGRSISTALSASAAIDRWRQASTNGRATAGTSRAASISASCTSTNPVQTRGNARADASCGSRPVRLGSERLVELSPCSNGATGRGLRRRVPSAQPCVQ